MCVVFVTSDEPTEVLEPANGALDLPAAAVAAELSAVLRGRLLAVLPVRGHQFHSAFRQPCAKRVAVGRRIVDQAARLGAQNAPIQERFDQRHFMGTGAGDFGTERKTAAVDENHGLGAFAALGLADTGAPFFAEENVPSAIASCQWMRPRRSSLRNNLAQAIFQMPASVQALRRRQHVAGDGKRGGKSLHRAPVRNTQRIPSIHSRAVRRGRPPFSEGGSSGNKSAISNHCSLVSCGSGSILDPTRAFARRLRDRFDIDNLLGCLLIRNHKPQRLAIIYGFETASRQTNCLTENATKGGELPVARWRCGVSDSGCELDRKMAVHPLPGLTRYQVMHCQAD